MRYRLFDFIVESDVELPEVERTLDGEPVMRIAREDNLARASVARWFHTVEGWHQEPWVEIGRTNAGFVLKFTEGAIVRSDGREIRWHTPDGFDRSAFRHMLLDQALPLLVSQQRAVLHASCVWRSGAAALFVGPAGVGKSTLAASLVRQCELSAADDAIAVGVVRGGVEACPEYGGVRLWPDSCDAIRYTGGEDLTSRSTKRRFSSPIPETGLILRAVYVLAPAPVTSVPALREMTRRDAVMALVRNSYVLDVEDRGRMGVHFDALSQIAARVPIRKLVLPRRFDALNEVGALLARDLPLGAIA